MTNVSVVVRNGLITDQAGQIIGRPGSVLDLNESDAAALIASGAAVPLAYMSGCLPVGGPAVRTRAPPSSVWDPAPPADR